MRDMAYSMVGGDGLVCFFLSWMCFGCIAIPAAAIVITLVSMFSDPAHFGKRECNDPADKPTTIVTQTRSGESF